MRYTKTMELSQRSWLERSPCSRSSHPRGHRSLALITLSEGMGQYGLTAQRFFFFFFFAAQHYYPLAKDSPLVKGLSDALALISHLRGGRSV